MDREQRIEVEIWKDIPGYEGVYQASDQGRIRSLDRVVSTQRGSYRLRGKVLRQAKTGSGYRSVGLSLAPAPPRTYRVYHLVLLAFVGPLPKGHHTRHINNDPADNRLANICYGTPQENANDRAKAGTVPRGGAHYNARLTEADVLEIRRRSAEGETSGSIGRSLGVTPSNIRCIVRRVSWKHVAATTGDI